MPDSSRLDRNLVTLSTRQPDLAARLGAADPAPDLEMIAARTGDPVPQLPRQGRGFPMHSRFDPAAEGRRLAQSAPVGYLVAFGLGGAYHLHPLLERTTLTGLLIVEKDLSLVRGLLERMDFTRLFADSRVLLLVDPRPEDLERMVLDRYLPVLYGDLGSITLRSRWDAETDWFQSRAEALKGLPESLGRDYTVQTRFGRRWFVHTLNNLARSEAVHAVLPPVRRLLVSAAGPSLEAQLPRIRRFQRDGDVLLATDTSLPLLSAAGLEPDIVLSIDCQVVSYHHFMARLPEHTVLILDLASPPLLTRRSDRILFFASGHPFSLYLNRLYRPFPRIDLSGGNVTHAALSLAEHMGAREVRLFGADFSYPRGRPYARGTYIYPYFLSRSHRTLGSEHSFWSFIHASRPVREILDDASWRWRTAAMDRYRDILESTTSRWPYVLHPEPGLGVSITTAPPTQTVRGGLSTMLSAGPRKQGWREFLGDYERRLNALPPLTGPPQDYLADLDAESRQAWATLLPAAATFRDRAVDGPSAVEDARLWTLNRIETRLSRPQSDTQQSAP